MSSSDFSGFLGPKSIGCVLLGWHKFSLNFEFGTKYVSNQGEIEKLFFEVKLLIPEFIIFLFLVLRSLTFAIWKHMLGR